MLSCRGDGEAQHSTFALLLCVCAAAALRHIAYLRLTWSQLLKDRGL